MGSGSLAPFIYNLGTTERWGVNFTLRPLYPRARTPSDCPSVCLSVRLCLPNYLPTYPSISMPPFDTLALLPTYLLTQSMEQSPS